MSRKALPENERRVVISVKRQYVEEAKALGFSNFDGYIEYLKLLARQQKTDAEAQPQIDWKGEAQGEYNSYIARRKVAEARCAAAQGAEKG